MAGRSTGFDTTVTVALQVPLPPVPSAVMVYVVETTGFTETLPAEVGVVLPMPLLMLTDVALELVQVSVAELRTMMGEVAERVQVAAGFEGV